MGSGSLSGLKQYGRAAYFPRHMGPVLFNPHGTEGDTDDRPAYLTPCSGARLGQRRCREAGLPGAEWPWGGHEICLSCSLTVSCPFGKTGQVSAGLGPARMDGVTA